MGTVSFAALEPLIIEAAAAPGMLAEFGVFRGDTLLKMLPLARRFRKQTLAVDSFRGMAEPSERDGRNYPAGKFNVGGPDALCAAVRAAGHADVVDIYEGFVPAILERIIDQQFCFAHVDLDHYQPTCDVLRWLWPRLSPGGIVVVHDYFADEPGLASAAVREFSAESGVPFDALESTHAIFRKGAE